MERKIVNAFIIIITSIVPLIITPWSVDYYYHPKIAIIYILCLIFALLYLFRLKKIKVKNQIQDYLLGAYLLLLILSTLFAVDKLQALRGRELREEGLAALFCYALIYYITSKYYIFKKKHLYFMLTAACIISIYGILQYFGYNIITPDVFRRNLTNQSYSTLGNRNFVGSYLVLILPISITGYIYSNKLYYLITSFILYSCLLCTLTRGAWLGFLCSVIYISLFVFKRKVNIKRYIIIMLMIFIISIGFNFISNGAVFGRFLSVGTDISSIMKGDSDNAGTNRMFIWKRAVKLIPDRPLLGCGPDNFGIVFMNRFQQEVYRDWMPIYVDKAHNEYLQIAVATGIPSLIIYLSFVSCILSKAIKNSKNSYFKIAFTASVIGYLIQAFFNISVVSVAPSFWAMLGTVNNFNNYIVEDKN